MNSLMLAGVVFAALACPTVAAAEVTPCQADDSRGVLAPERADATVAPAPPVVARQSAASARDVAETRAEPPRRRSGKRVPDAELIGPRGAL